MTRLLGLKNVKTLRRWVGSGCPHQRTGTSDRAPLEFDPTAVRAWMEAVGRTGATGRPPDGMEPRDDLGARADAPALSSGADKDDAPPTDALELRDLTARVNLRIKQLEAEKRERVEAVARGELVSAAEAEAGWSRACAGVRSRILAVPGAVAGRLVGLADPRDVEGVLDEALRAALAELAEG